MMVTNLTGGPIHLVQFKDESFINNAQIMKSETGKVEDDYIYASEQDILNIDEIPWYFQNYYNIPSLGNKYAYEENNRKISVFYNSSILRCKQTKDSIRGSEFDGPNLFAVNLDEALAICDEIENVVFPCIKVIDIWDGKELGYCCLASPRK